jgi:exoribonuclease R
MTVSQINSAICAGTFTNDELTSIIDAVKFARARLAQRVRFQVRAGSQVRFTSSKTGMVVDGTVTKMAQKYATVSTAQGLWKVPANMLEIVA